MALSKAQKAIFKAKYGNELYDLLVAAENVIVTESDNSEVSLADKLAALATAINGKASPSDINTAISAAISSVYKPGGSFAFASLPSADASHEGYVYDVTEEFTITSAFKEYESGKTKKYPAGTNVVVVRTSAADAETATFAYDVLPGFIDLSGYAKSTDLHSHENKTVLDSITQAKVEAWDAAGRVYVSDTQPSTMKAGDIWLQTFTE